MITYHTQLVTFASNVFVSTTSIIEILLSQLQVLPCFAAASVHAATCCNDASVLWNYYIDCVIQNNLMQVAQLIHNHKKAQSTHHEPQFTHN